VKAKPLMLVVIVAGVLMVSRSLYAHHGAAAYDMSKPVAFKDVVVTKYSWINPHALIFFDVKDEIEYLKAVGDPAGSDPNGNPRRY
jgi:Family of unknown function (DUF6152)